MENEKSITRYDGTVLTDHDEAIIRCNADAASHVIEALTKAPAQALTRDYITEKVSIALICINNLMQFSDVNSVEDYFNRHTKGS